MLLEEEPECPIESDNTGQTRQEKDLERAAFHESAQDNDYHENLHCQ